MALRIALNRVLSRISLSLFLSSGPSAHYAHIVVVAVWSAISIRSKIFCAVPLPGTASTSQLHICLCQLLCAIAHVDTLMPTVPTVCACVRPGLDSNRRN